jgi:hypothetical protein
MEKLRREIDQIEKNYEIKNFEHKNEIKDILV